MRRRRISRHLVHPKRDRMASGRFFCKLLRRTGREPRVIVTDKLRSYAAAKRNVLPHFIHRQSRNLNNRARSRISLRDGERRMKKLKPLPEQAQQFLSVFGLTGRPVRDLGRSRWSE